MEYNRLLEIAADRETCDFCPDCDDINACMQCKKVKPISCDELSEYHAAVTDALHRTAEDERLEREGLLVRLPCRLGDTLYRVRRFTRGENWRKEAAFVQPIKLTMSNVAKIVLGGELGKTVFLTHQEAEAALQDKSKYYPCRGHDCYDRGNFHASCSACPLYGTHEAALGGGEGG